MNFKKTLALTLLCCHGLTYSAVSQIFNGFNYANPATLSFVKNKEITMGGTYVRSNVEYRGSGTNIFGVTSPYGTENSIENDYLPYGRFVFRANKYIVLGLYVTRPELLDTNWNLNDFAVAASTATQLHTTSISPKMSLQVTQKLSLGGGLDIDDVSDFQINFAIPTFGNLVNDSHAWDLGWDAGFNYVASKRTIIGGAYYSNTNSITRGTSWLDTVVIPPVNYNLYARRAAIAYLNLVRYLSQKWLVSGTIYWSNWKKLTKAVFTNTAVGNLTFPLNWNNTVSYSLYNRWQVSKKTAIFANLLYETQAAPENLNYIAFLTGNALALTLGLDFSIDQKLAFQMSYTHEFFTRSPVRSVFANGYASLDLNAVDGRIVYSF